MNDQITQLEISPEMAHCPLMCTSSADTDSLAQAYQACLDLGSELMTEMRIKFQLELPVNLMERFAERFSKQVSPKYH